MVNDSRLSVRLDSIGVRFDDQRSVADAGLLLPATLAGRLGLAGYPEPGLAEIAEVEADHRRHAVVELAIRDLKAGALAHFPSGGLLRQLGLDPARRDRAQPRPLVTDHRHPRSQPADARNLPAALLRIPASLVRSARKLTLRLPARWPWQRAFIEALKRIRALPALG